MKKIALGFVASLLIAAPAVACPGMEGGHDNTPKTAEKKKADEPKKDAAKPAEKTAEKKDTAKPAEPKKDAAPAKPAPAKPDKVSAR